MPGRLPVKATGAIVSRAGTLDSAAGLASSARPPRNAAVAPIAMFQTAAE